MKPILFIFMTFIFSFALLQTQNAAAQGVMRGSYDRTQGNDRIPTGRTPSNPNNPATGSIIRTETRSYVLSSKETAKLELKNAQTYLNAASPNYERAAYWLELAVGDNPKLKRAFLLLGSVYNHQGLFAKAIAAYNSALELDAESVDAFVGLGASNFNLKNYQTAIDYYEKAVKADAKNFNANIMLANGYFMLKRFDAAANAYQKSLQIDSKSVEANFNLALCYLKLNNRDAALKQNEMLKNLSKPASEKLGIIINQATASPAAAAQSKR